MSMLPWLLLAGGVYYLMTRPTLPVAGTSTGLVTVGLYDPTGQSPATLQWPPHPAPPPSGYHWQHSGSPAIAVDPATGQPLPGSFTGSWLLVRDGYTMPMIM